MEKIKKMEVNFGFSDVRLSIIRELLDTQDNFSVRTGYINDNDDEVNFIYLKEQDMFYIDFKLETNDIKFPVRAEMNPIRFEMLLDNISAYKGDCVIPTVSISRYEIYLFSEILNNELADYAEIDTKESYVIRCDIKEFGKTIDGNIIDWYCKQTGMVIPAVINGVDVDIFYDLLIHEDMLKSWLIGVSESAIMEFNKENKNGKI